MLPILEESIYKKILFWYCLPGIVCICYHLVNSRYFTPSENSVELSLGHHWINIKPPLLYNELSQRTGNESIKIKKSGKMLNIHTAR